MSLTTTSPRSNARHEADYAYGYNRTQQMTTDLEPAALAQYREVWRLRLVQLELGTQAYAVALGAWTALHHRLGNVPASPRLRDRIRRAPAPGRARSCTFQAAGGYR
ncbi:hypothetical protein ACFWUU_40320 [Kribbella sp. NPDC058693]|uniref:hypothetical protein n=1 Tax=Kribbella sp. NPDC058693 TaxID=3346602 RepID=UPI003652505F